MVEPEQRKNTGSHVRRAPAVETPQPPVRAAVADGWRLIQAEYDPDRNAHQGSLFALANGSFGVRADEEELGQPGGTYLAAVYERHPIEFHERLPGFARNTDTRMPVAAGTLIDVVLDGQRLQPEHCERLDFQRTLDLCKGTLQRTTTWRTPQGRVRIHAERVVAPDRDVLAIRFTVESLDFNGKLSLVSRLRAGAQSAGQGDDPRIGAGAGSTLETATAQSDGHAQALLQRAHGSGVSVGVAQAHRFAIARQASASVAQDAGAGNCAASFDIRLAPGESATLEKFVAYSATGEGGDTTDLVPKSRALAIDAVQTGYDALAVQRAGALRAFWDTARIDVDADMDANADAEAAQAGTALALRFNLFHLLQSSSRDAWSGTAAKGLTGEGYEGHCFWDTEAFVLPVMALTAPHTARAMLAYRYRLLDAARANAREMNHASGALYPWRTIAGAECSAHYPSGSAAYHINAAIAYAIGLYLDATGDEDFLLAEGAEMLFETARIWPQAGHVDPRRGGFGIYCVTGPDEYTALVDNNFYTNRMAQRHLQRAVQVWETLSRSHPDGLRALASRIDLSQAEIDQWREIARTMLLPVDDALGIYPQDDTFLHKPHWDFAAHPPGRPLLLDQHPLTLYRHQVCKQADVVMALVLAGDGLDEPTMRRSFDYYEAITTHDSTLSAAIHGILASQLGLNEKALHYFEQALRVDLDDLHGNSHHGVHMAAMAGSWLGLSWGFAGLRIIDGQLHFAPRLPPGWSRYRFGLHWRGRRLVVEVDTAGTRYELIAGEPLTVMHRGRDITLEVRTPSNQACTPPPAASSIGHLGAPVARSTTQFPLPARALIFDLDGVLTDSARMHYQAWKRLADEIGVPFSERDNLRLKGVDRAASLEILLERSPRKFDAQGKQALADRKNGYYLEAVAKVGPRDLFPGAAELLAQARTFGLGTALASASRNAGELVRRLGIANAFDVIVDAGQIARQKPAPDIFLAAANALGIAAADCIGIEDAAAGVRAIHAAGMPAIGIGTQEELPEADAVVASIAELKLADFVVQTTRGAQTPAYSNRNSPIVEGS